MEYKHVGNITLQTQGTYKLGVLTGWARYIDAVNPTYASFAGAYGLISTNASRLHASNCIKVAKTDDDGKVLRISVPMERNKILRAPLLVGLSIAINDDTGKQYMTDKVGVLFENPPRPAVHPTRSYHLFGFRSEYGAACAVVSVSSRFVANHVYGYSNIDKRPAPHGYNAYSVIAQKIGEKYPPMITNEMPDTKITMEKTRDMANDVEGIFENKPKEGDAQKIREGTIDAVVVKGVKLPSSKLKLVNTSISDGITMVNLDGTASLKTLDALAAIDGKFDETLVDHLIEQSKELERLSATYKIIAAAKSNSGYSKE